jgi:hypothetical protein
MGSNDSGSVKADGFLNGEGDMAKKPKQIDRPATQEAIEPIEIIEPVEAVAVIEIPIPREDCTLQEILHPEISPLTKEEESIAESIPRFRPRDCVQCTAKRPTRSSYSRVYCTKGNTRYVRCGWKPCGYRYKQVEE